MAGKTVKHTKATNSDENRKKIAAFEARRKRRLDEAEAEKEKEEAAAVNADTDSEVTEEIKENGDTPPADNDKPSVEERVSLIKDRRDRRDADGDAADLEAAKAAIAEQDEDIEQLIEIVEELQAANDIAAANTDNDEGSEENKDEIGRASCRERVSRSV